VSQKFLLDPKDKRRDAILANVLAFIAALPVTKPWSIEVKRYVKERTNLQNKALWGCAYKALHEASGNDPEDLHTYFCGEFWSWVEVDVMGQTKRKPFRTTTHDENGKRDVIETVELAKFYEFIQRRAIEAAGVYVPDPDPLWFRKEQWND
jgi:hypothetical protein